MTTKAPPVNDEASKLQQRLDDLARDIAEAGARAARAKEAARFQECKASVERVNAEARASQAACVNGGKVSWRRHAYLRSDGGVASVPNQPVLSPRS